MCHVLIIEDEPVVALDIEAVLQDHGATSFAFTMTEADAVRAGRARRPDLITSDVKLVEGIGPRAVQALHETWGDILVIFITGTPEACLPCEPPGRIVPKPIDPVRIGSAFP